MLVCVRVARRRRSSRKPTSIWPLPDQGEWEGKQDIPVTLVHAAYRDFIVFPDGESVLLAHMADSVRVDIGIPVKPKVSKGMKVVNAAIVEAMALPPEPKPEDEPQDSEKPAEPAPEQREREPSQGDD